MIIERDGKEYKLTSSELYQAYEEYEHGLDVGNIEDNLQSKLDSSEYEKLKDNKDFIEDAAYELRRGIDKYGLDYDFALDEAITETKDEYLMKEGI